MNLTSALSLAFRDFQQPFIVQNDTSSVADGALLSQKINMVDCIQSSSSGLLRIAQSVTIRHVEEPCQSSGGNIFR